MNPVLILTRNNLELTKRCVESVNTKQDIETVVLVSDNASTDGTIEWLKSIAANGHQENAGNSVWGFVRPTNDGVSRGWNHGLDYWFRVCDAEYALVIGNDTILPPYLYSSLLSVDAPFVTGVDMGMDPLPDKPDILPLSPHPDFSCFLIRRECWEKVGPFDERMVSYAGDCDYHVRAHRLGVPLMKACVPYNHERSSTMKNASIDERVKLHEQAHRDREVFKSLYGCLPGTPAYEKLFE